MPKRSRIKRETTESKALKRLRLIRGVSQRDAAKLIGVAPTTVNHSENGREYVRDDYVEKFLKGLGFGWEDWHQFVEAKPQADQMRESCIQIISKMESHKLQIVHNLLLNL